MSREREEIEERERESDQDIKKEIKRMEGG